MNNNKRACGRLGAGMHEWCWLNMAFGWKQPNLESEATKYMGLTRIHGAWYVWMMVFLWIYPTESGNSSWFNQHCGGVAGGPLSGVSNSGVSEEVPGFFRVALIDGSNLTASRARGIWQNWLKIEKSWDNLQWLWYFGLNQGSQKHVCVFLCIVPSWLDFPVAQPSNPRLVRTIPLQWVSFRHFP